MTKFFSIRSGAFYSFCLDVVVLKLAVTIFLAHIISGIKVLILFRV
jgi:hypothetical protein